MTKNCYKWLEEQDKSNSQSKNSSQQKNKGKSGETLITVTGTLYTASGSSSNILLAGAVSQSHLWHSRLGHMSEKGMKVLRPRGLLPELESVDVGLCEQCVLGKQKRIDEIERTEEEAEPELDEPIAESSTPLALGRELRMRRAPDSVEHGSGGKLRVATVRCEDDLSAWGSRGRNLHSAARGVLRKCSTGLPPKEELVRTETGSSTVVSKVR
ncbi:Uncharacterized mitochondrial protein AtMg00300 [Striga hermonthica]|uniref:Uncharacterized mitochondrial protein AtMg00300 n=1 Tax=Striga hermonthica TaxID=68872 RepID=A0A9N7ML36_STRHE|nr:Uncharacterized mitochondrial protein AtMg00300 [Striga hermonthica]